MIITASDPTRSWFGGTNADFVFSTFAFAGQDLLRLSSGTIRFWDSASGGAAHTDLLVDGTPASEIDVGDDGLLPRFQGPVGVTSMWAGADGAARVMVVTTDAADVHLDRVAAEAAAEAAEAVGAANDSLVAGLVTDEGSDTRSALDDLFTTIGGGGEDLATQAAVDALTTQQDALMASGATIEELSVAVYDHGRWSGSPSSLFQTLGSAAGQNIKTVWTAPWACSILSLDVVVETGDISADDSDYITLELRKSHSGTATVIASKTTKATGGEAIAGRIPWSFDGATWDATNRVFVKGDLLQLRWVATGSAVLTWPASYTFRIAPS